jgi:hypothetical protein
MNVGGMRLRNNQWQLSKDLIKESCYLFQILPYDIWKITKNLCIAGIQVKIRIFTDFKMALEVCIIYFYNLAMKVLFFFFFFNA